MASTVLAGTSRSMSAICATCRVMVSSNGCASMSARTAASTASAISRSTRSTARLTVRASLLITRSTALSCTTAGRDITRAASVPLIFHSLTACCNAGTALLFSDRTWAK